jgi:hypothetical protein
MAIFGIISLHEICHASDSSNNLYLLRAGSIDVRNPIHNPVRSKMIVFGACCAKAGSIIL